MDAETEVVASATPCPTAGALKACFINSKLHRQAFLGNRTYENALAVQKAEADRQNAMRKFAVVGGRDAGQKP